MNIIRPATITKIRSKKFFKKILSLSVFAEPRPKYIAKVTFFDEIFLFTILPFIPKYVRPNLLTVLRFVSIPFILILLIQENYLWGFWLFVVSAFSDAVDGALARTRHQITDWGIVFDPLADKLLISSVGVFVIYKLINPWLLGVIIFLEILLIIFSYTRFTGQLVPAKTAGKIKMILQSFGVGFLLLSLLTGQVIFITIATYILYLAVVFALLSLFVYRSI